MADVTRTCEWCGGRFAARRADAAYCGATCRQRARRERTDPIKHTAPSATRTRRSSIDRLDRLVTNVVGPAVGLSLVDRVEHLNIPKALTAPDEKLAEWDRELTNAIQLLGRLRRAIRDARQRHG